jgi:hypothetical protein
MLMVLFAFLAVASAWTAWRRNPLYSTRGTLRSVALVLAAIGAVIGLMITAVNFTADKSPVVVGSTLAAVIVFGALSLIFIIQAVTTPRDEKLATALPPSATLVHDHRKKVYKWAKRLAIFLAVCGILGLLIPGDAGYIPWGLGGFALFMGLIMLPVGYVTARNFDRSLTALELSPWVHWQYAPEQWKQWTDAQVERLKATPPTFIMKRDWRKLVLMFASMAVPIYIFCPGTVLEKTLYILFICGLLFAIVEGSIRDGHRAPERLRTTLQNAAPEAYFGHDGVFCDGIYTTWLTIDNYLLSASIDERQPRSLLFRFEKVVPSPYSGNSIIPISQSVLIPPGAESDIKRLQQELTARCPTAKIVLL